MVFYHNKIKTVSINCQRFISQFARPRTDCIPYIPPKKIIDPKACKQRDKGLVLGLYENDSGIGDKIILTETAKRYDAKVAGKLSKLLKLTPVPKLGETRVFIDLDPHFGYVSIAGLGSICTDCSSMELMDQQKEAVRIAAAMGTKALAEFRPSTIHVETLGDAEAAAEGAGLVIWKFQEYKKLQNQFIPPALYLYENEKQLEEWETGALKAESQNLARYLQEMPANFLNPKAFGKLCIELLSELDINIEVKAEGWAAFHNMGGFVGIGKSSVQQPLYIEANYFGADNCTKPIALIGKGVTFNSGSIDLKSPEDLKNMRGDMAGAACVLAIIRAAAILKLPVNLKGIFPMCELMPNGKSPRFGDVVNSAIGKTVHIRQPRHQGRLLIADSILHAQRYDPQFIVDIGTISKQLMNYLGGAASACYTNNEAMYCHIENASAYTGDRIWRMPLWKFYEERIADCQTADLANTARIKYADSANCAAFLKQFLCDDIPWIHLDTYNVAYTKGRTFPYLERGMTGRPTRTVIELLYQILNYRNNRPPVKVLRMQC